MKLHRFWMLSMAVLLTSVLTMARTVRAEDEEKKEEHMIKGSVAAEKGTEPAKLVKMAKISFTKALSIAVKKVPGHAIKGELEAEDGSLVYSFEVVGSDGSVTEVEVDGGNGVVLDVDKEEANKNKKEEDKDEEGKD